MQLFIVFLLDSPLSDFAVFVAEDSLSQFFHNTESPQGQSFHFFLLELCSFALYVSR